MNFLNKVDPLPTTIAHTRYADAHVHQDHFGKWIKNPFSKRADELHMTQMMKHLSVEYRSFTPDEYDTPVPDAREGVFETDYGMMGYFPLTPKEEEYKPVKRPKGWQDLFGGEWILHEPVPTRKDFSWVPKAILAEPRREFEILTVEEMVGNCQQRACENLFYWLSSRWYTDSRFSERQFLQRIVGWRWGDWKERKADRERFAAATRIACA